MKRSRISTGTEFHIDGLGRGRVVSDGETVEIPFEIVPPGFDEWPDLGPIDSVDLSLKPCVGRVVEDPPLPDPPAS